MFRKSLGCYVLDIAELRLLAEWSQYLLRVNMVNQPHQAAPKAVPCLVANRALPSLNPAP